MFPPADLAVCFASSSLLHSVLNATMSSNSQLSASFPAAKSNASASSSNSAPVSQLGPPSSGNEPQRRSGGGAVGTSVTARNILSAPRGVQAGRKSHKNHRKPNTPRYGEEQTDEVRSPLYASYFEGQIKRLTGNSGRNGATDWPQGHFDHPLDELERCLPTLSASRLSPEYPPDPDVGLGLWLPRS